MNAPCKDCGNHRPGCHGGCERYLAFKGELDRRNSELRKCVPAREFSRDSYVRAQGAGRISFYENRRRIEHSAERRMKAYAKSKAELIAPGGGNGP